MGYRCVEHTDTAATIIVTMLEDGTTIGLCGDCVHPWMAGIAAATDPEAIEAAKAQAMADRGPSEPLEGGTDPLDEAVAEPATVEDWTHPLDRAEAAEAAPLPGNASTYAEAGAALDRAMAAPGDLEGDPADARAVETLAGALDGPDWPANEPAEV